VSTLSSEGEVSIVLSHPVKKVKQGEGEEGGRPSGAIGVNEFFI